MLDQERVTKAAWALQFSRSSGPSRPGAAGGDAEMSTESLSTATLADLAVTHPAASRVFHRHSLDFCCHGRRPLAEACAERGLVVEEVLAEIADEQPGGEGLPRWGERPIPELVKHIVDFYHLRLRAELPELISLAAKVETRHAEKASCPRGLRAHLEVVYRAVLEHLAKEEQVLFPMILAGRAKYAAGPIHVMESEHRDHAENLQKARALTADLVAPPEACPTWRALYLRLNQLEAELMEHIHLENNVLFRRVLAA
jgi:regulator of cell morphogenesis and NO signaling